MSERAYRVYGVDPGLTGAIALIEDRKLEGGPVEVTVWDMPLRVVSKKKVKGKVQTKYGVNSYGVYNTMMPMGCPGGVVYVEKVHAMPGRDTTGKAVRSMGATSAFNFGASFGIVLAACELVRPVHLVTPQAWKKHHNLVGATKDASLELARLLFPSVKDRCLTRKKDIGRAEALLIALYGIQLEKEKRGHAVR
jgi:hypothetical protein